MRFTRRLILSVIVLAGLFFGANIVAQKIAESRIASQAKKSFHTSKTPKVSLQGFPIILKILQGLIPHATLEAHDVNVQDVPISVLTVVLDGVHAKLADLSGGKPIRIDRGLATAVVDEPAVNSYVRSRGHQVSIQIRLHSVVASKPIPGIGTGVAEGAPRIVGRLLVFAPEHVRVGGKPLSGPALREARRQLSFEVDLPLLPGGIRLTGIDLVPHQARLVARLDNTMFQF